MCWIRVSFSTVSAIALLGFAGTSPRLCASWWIERHERGSSKRNRLRRNHRGEPAGAAGAVQTLWRAPARPVRLSSDLDFLVEFEPMPPSPYAKVCRGLRDGLEQLFGRPIDLLTEPALVNPYLRRQIESEKRTLYP